MASPTQRTSVWASSRSWWRAGKPGVLQSMGPQRVRHDWATEVNWWLFNVIKWNTDLMSPIFLLAFQIKIPAKPYAAPPKRHCHLQRQFREEQTCPELQQATPSPGLSHRNSWESGPCLSSRCQPWRCSALLTVETFHPPLVLLNRRTPRYTRVTHPWREHLHHLPMGQTKQWNVHETPLVTCRGRRKAVRTANSTRSLEKSVLPPCSHSRPLPSHSPPHPLSLLPHPLIPSSPHHSFLSSSSHSPLLPSISFEFQYRLKEMEESGYNPGILGGKGTISLLASPGQIHCGAAKLFDVFWLVDIWFPFYRCL